MEKLQVPPAARSAEISRSSGYRVGVIYRKQASPYGPVSKRVMPENYGSSALMEGKAESYTGSARNTAGVGTAHMCVVSNL